MLSHYTVFCQERAQVGAMIVLHWGKKMSTTSLQSREKRMILCSVKTFDASCVLQSVAS